MNDKKYIVILHSGTLKTEVLEYNKSKPIREYIGSDYIDHSSAFDELEKRKIDLWVDDEGLLKSLDPIFIFTSHNDITGFLVGNAAFLKYDNDGNSLGLNEEEKDFILKWLKSHIYRSFDTGLIRGEPETGKYLKSYIVRPYETEQHRKSIQETKEMIERLKSEGVEIIEEHI